jgi:hypothetical protein
MSLANMLRILTFLKELKLCYTRIQDPEFKILVRGEEGCMTGNSFLSLKHAAGSGAELTPQVQECTCKLGDRLKNIPRHTGPDRPELKHPSFMGSAQSFGLSEPRFLPPRAITTLPHRTD